MDTYVMMNGKKFDSVESAVEAAESMGLMSCELDIYLSNGDYVDTQKLDRDEDEQFVYTTYGVFVDSPDGCYWANRVEVTFDTPAQASEYAKSLEAYNPDELEIHAIEQTLSEYCESCFYSSVFDF